jgi:FdhD protein
MLGKAARMQVPVIATLNSPTHLVVELAREWGITLIGYVRGTRMQIYTGWQRIIPQNDANCSVYGKIDIELALDRVSDI